MRQAVQLARPSFWGRIGASGLSKSLVCSRKRKAIAVIKGTQWAQASCLCLNDHIGPNIMFFMLIIPCVKTTIKGKENFEMIKFTQTWFLF